MLGIEIRGLVELQRKVDQVVTDLHGKPMLDGMRKATMLVTTDAKKLAPVDTGLLRSSITPEIRAQANEVIGVVGSKVVYAPYQETGTKAHWPPISALQTWARRHGVNAFLVARAIARHGVKPKRFLQRAFEQNEKAIIHLLDAVVGKIIHQ